MSTQRWIFFLMMSLSLAMVALAWLARPVFCLDSRLVDKVDISGPAGEMSLPACRTSRGASYREELAALKRKIEPRLSRLEKELQFFGAPVKPLRLSIVESSAPVVRVHPTHLILSNSVLEDRILFEKSFLMSLLLQQASAPVQSLSPDDVLWTDVFTDLFLEFSHGRILADGSRTEWPLALRTPVAYCQDSWRSHLHTSKCEQEKITDVDAFVSLRPFVGRAFSKSLRALSLEDRLTFFRQTLSGWKTRRVQKLVYGSSFASREKQQLIDAAMGLQNLTKNFAKWGETSAVWTKLTQGFIAQIQAQGFREMQAPLTADLIVMGGEPENESLLLALSELALKNRDKRVIYLTENEVRVLPELKPLPRVWLGALQSRQAILIQCPIPSIERLKRLSDSTQKLLLVRDCQSPLKIDFQEALKGGFEKFVTRNPQMQFIKFHLPSLKAALAKRNLNPIMLLDEKRWDSPFFQEIGWQKPEWDHDIKVYRARAAIDAIEMYRGLESEPSVAL